MDYLQAKTVLEKKYPDIKIVGVTLFKDLYMFAAHNKNAKPHPRTGEYWISNYTVNKDTGKEVEFSPYGLSDELSEELSNSEFIEFE